MNEHALLDRLPVERLAVRDSEVKQVTRLDVLQAGRAIARPPSPLFRRNTETAAAFWSLDRKEFSGFFYGGKSGWFARGRGPSGAVAEVSPVVVVACELSRLMAK